MPFKKEIQPAVTVNHAHYLLHNTKKNSLNGKTLMIKKGQQT